jgi:hypothetical protein
VLSRWPNPFTGRVLMRARFGWLAGVLVLGLARPASGQSPDSPLVRILVRGEKAVTGQLVSAAADSVVIRDAQGERLSYPVSAIQRRDVRGPGSRGENAWYGTYAGIVGMGVGMAIVAARTEYANADGREVFFTSLALPLGALIGYLMPPGTRWVRQPLPQVGWDGRAVHVGFSLRVP